MVSALYQQLQGEWWNFSQRFVNGLDRCGVKPRIVGLHGRDNPVIKPEDIAGIFRDAGRLPTQFSQASESDLHEAKVYEHVEGTKV